MNTSDPFGNLSDINKENNNQEWNQNIQMDNHNPMTNNLDQG